MPSSKGVKPGLSQAQMDYEDAWHGGNVPPQPLLAPAPPEMHDIELPSEASKKGLKRAAGGK